VVWRHSRRIQTNEVVAMAQIVPIGIDFCASARSPERFEPAMIPAQPVRIVLARRLHWPQLPIHAGHSLLQKVNSQVKVQDDRSHEVNPQNVLYRLIV